MEPVEDITDIPLHGTFQGVRFVTSDSAAFSNNSVEIYVTNPTLKEDTFSKHITYCIQGHDLSGNFQVFRRYSDFLTVRNQLSQKWPGCYIPPVPPKQFIGNLSSKFIEARRHQLEYFVQNTSSISFLYTSPEFQQFIRSKLDYEKAPFRLSYKEISQTYQTLFMDFTRSQILPENIKKLEDYDEFFKSSYNILLNFKRSVKSVGLQFHIFQGQYCELNTKLQDMENGYIRELRDDNSVVFVPIDQKSLDNPFLELYNWAKQEALDIKSIIDTLGFKLEIDALKAKIEKKMHKGNKSLRKIQQGKTSLSAIFSSTTKTEQLATAEVQIKDLEDEISDLEVIRKILIVRLCEHELPIFKSTKIKNYESMMNKYAELTVSGFKSITDTARGIQNRIGS